MGRRRWRVPSVKASCGRMARWKRIRKVFSQRAMVSRSNPTKNWTDRRHRKWVHQVLRNGLWNERNDWNELSVWNHFPLGNSKSTGNLVPFVPFVPFVSKTQRKWRFWSQRMWNERNDPSLRSQRLVCWFRLAGASDECLRADWRPMFRRAHGRLFFCCDYNNSTGNGDYLFQNSFIKNFCLKYTRKVLNSILGQIRLKGKTLLPKNQNLLFKKSKKDID